MTCNFEKEKNGKVLVYCDLFMKKCTAVDVPSYDIINFYHERQVNFLEFYA